MFRSSAGNSAVLAEYLNSALKSASPNDDDDDDEELDVDDLTTASRDSRSYAHNAHWLPAGSGGPSRYVGYYDAASLYPSSGRLILFVFFARDEAKTGPQLVSLCVCLLWGRRAKRGAHNDLTPPAAAAARASARVCVCVWWGGGFECASSVFWD